MNSQSQISSQQTSPQFNNQYDPNLNQHGQQQINMTGHQLPQYAMNNYHQCKFHLNRCSN